MPDPSTLSEAHRPPPEESLSSRRAAWRWVPTLYFAEGIPYIVVMVVAGIMYKRLGVSNAQIALYTSWLGMPWVIKPFWSPLVDLLKSKRWWIVTMQLLIGAGLAGVALTIPADSFFQFTLAFLFLLAFSSATHDIAADGFYMLSLSPNNQAWFVGIRSTFYRLAMITGQGLLVVVAGLLESGTGLPSVTVDIHAVAPTGSTASVEPGSMVELDPTGELRIVFHSSKFDIERSAKTEADITALVQRARAWNLSHGFYSQEEQTVQEKAGQKAPWLLAMEEWLRKRFGPEIAPEVPDANAGNAGLIHIALEGTLDPNRKVVVQFARTAGTKDIRIREGERFTVTSENRNAPMVAVVQLHAKLDRDAVATFTATSGNSTLAWAVVFYLAAGLFLALCAYHFLALPHPLEDGRKEDRPEHGLVAEFFTTFATFFQKKDILATLCFLLLYRFAEAQLTRIAPLFLIDSHLKGGMSLTTAEIGITYGTVGVVMLLLGGVLGGFLAARDGLRAWIWWMVLAINLPNAVYVFLSMARPESLVVINCAVGLEQFGYGFGFAAYMLYMLYISQGEHETAHFAICTGFMALGVMLPGMWSGWLQELIGYEHYFIWILVATVPSFLVVAWIKVDPEFGKKSSPGESGETD